MSFDYAKVLYTSPITPQQTFMTKNPLHEMISPLTKLPPNFEEENQEEERESHFDRLPIACISYIFEFLHLNERLEWLLT